jgi:nitroimidazol reductase NimA-like FMN-containing flavoprotein (pyridoxamine 5'-phosphate oxidase superfamily)
MSSADPRAFRPLDREATDALLARNRVGRIAYSRRGALEVEPVLYGMEGGWLWARLAYGHAWGSPGEGGPQGRPVVFEVDEVDSGFCWRSVVVRGTLHPVEHPADGGDPALWVHAVEVIRTVDPAAVAGAASLRASLVRVAVHAAAGREAAGG